MKDDKKNKSPAAAKKSAESTGLREGEDFTWEGELMLLSAGFLKKRGYCCRTGCRNCPYEPKWNGPAEEEEA